MRDKIQSSSSGIKTYPTHSKEKKLRRCHQSTKFIRVILRVITLKLVLRVIIEKDEKDDVSQYDFFHQTMTEQKNSSAETNLKILQGRFIK